MIRLSVTSKSLISKRILIRNTLNYNLWNFIILQLCTIIYQFFDCGYNRSLRSWELDFKKKNREWNAVSKCQLNTKRMTLDDYFIFQIITYPNLKFNSFILSEHSFNFEIYSHSSHESWRKTVVRISEILWFFNVKFNKKNII